MPDSPDIIYDDIPIVSKTPSQFLCGDQNLQQLENEKYICLKTFCLKKSLFNQLFHINPNTIFW